MPPTAFAALTNSSSSWTVKNTTAAVEPESRSRAATSKPFIPTIPISRTMTSGRRLPAAFSAAGPFVTAATTTHPDPSTAAARESISSLSSTMRTRVTSDDVVLDGILNELRGRLDLQLVHHSVLVKGDGSRREIQDA